MTAYSSFSPVSLKFAKTALWSSLSFMALLAALHGLEPEYSPSWHFISEYELGSFGFLMRLAFLLLAVSCISLGLALWGQLKVLGQIGVIMLFVSAIGMMIAAIYLTDPLNAAKETFHGKMHQLGPLFDSIPFASVFISISLMRKNALWKQAGPTLVLSTLLVWAGIIIFAVSMDIYFPADHHFGPLVLLGWPNRIMIIVQAVWLFVMSRKAIIINSLA